MIFGTKMVCPNKNVEPYVWIPFSRTSPNNVFLKETDSDFPFSRLKRERYEREQRELEEKKERERVRMEELDKIREKVSFET